MEKAIPIDIKVDLDWNDTSDVIEAMRRLAMSTKMPVLVAKQRSPKK